MNIFNPSNVSFLEALILSYILGIVHGITPDEHTWPITFSYSIGTYSTKGGAKAGTIFSLGFTLQRAILSELAYFALAGLFMSEYFFGIVYVIVGAVMFWAGLYIMKAGRYLHWHTLECSLYRIFGIHKHKEKQEKKELEHEINPVNEIIKGKFPLRLAALHGFIAGFGFGAFALIIYTVLSPAMPSPYLGWVPGALFGIGTMTMQIILGMFFGYYMKTRKLNEKGMKFVARYTSSFVLTYGGIAFAIAGALVLIFPQILNFGISTGINIPNLDSLDIGFFLVIIVVGVLGWLGYRRAMKMVKTNPKYFSS